MDQGNCVVFFHLTSLGGDIHQSARVDALLYSVATPPWLFTTMEQAVIA